MQLPSRSVLCDLIADALHQESANQLPTVCERLGLAAGEREEAFRSKRSYVRSRLNASSMENLQRIGAEVVADYPHLELEEALACLAEDGNSELSEISRGRVLRVLAHVSLSGNINLTTFLADLWPIRSMPSRWQAGKTLEDDVVRHMILNDDWTSEDLLNQLGALTCSRQRFFRMLEAVVHPRIRDEAAQNHLVENLNPILRRDGFSLVVTKRISGFPVYTVQETTPTGYHPADGLISEGLAAFDESSVHAMWQKALNRRAEDPEGAITAARTLLETVCKHIIEDAGATYAETDDLPRLYRTAARELSLVPDQHTEEVFKAILGSCQSIVTNLGSLRNRLSDAHGRGRRPARPQIRHAELAVNLAGTFAVFLVATWNARQAQPEKTES